jgi:uncharacterized protein YfiM (DUF2279 family)
MPDASPPAAVPGAVARWTPPAVWLAIVLVGTSWPRLVLGPDGVGLDKIAHFSAYAILAALALRATLTPRRLVTAVGVVVLVSVLGGIDEWHQSFIPGRSMSGADWMADTAGAIVGTLAVRLIPFLTPRRRPLS